jgi:hypothetical protein
MTSIPILIRGAAGSVAFLLQTGFPARAIVRGDDQRAQSFSRPRRRSLCR